MTMKPEGRVNDGIVCRRMAHNYDIIYTLQDFENLPSKHPGSFGQTLYILHSFQKLRQLVPCFSTVF